MVGHIVSKNGVATDPKKLNMISKLHFHTANKALWGFLGMVGYYQKFIHMFATKTHLLTRFLHEDAPTPMEDEASKCAFKQLKSILQATLILQTLDWKKPFLAYYDASWEAVENTLSQLDENGHDHPIHLACKQLTSIEKNYTMT